MPQKKSKGTRKRTPTVKKPSGKGIGRKLAVYVPKSDEFVIDEIEELKKARQSKGYRTSLSFELIRLAKLGLQHRDAKK
jgi:hypothetical protein